MGGFHLNGPLFEPIIDATCDALIELAPEIVVPTHCTGWKAIDALAARLPEAFKQNSVGTTFELQAEKPPKPNETLGSYQPAMNIIRDGQDPPRSRCHELGPLD
jgi:hypothetical protein